MCNSVMDPFLLQKNFTFISLLYLPCVVEARVKVLGVSLEVFPTTMPKVERCGGVFVKIDRIPSTTPGAEPPRDARDSGSARSHSTHLETSSSDRP